MPLPGPMLLPGCPCDCKNPREGGTEGNTPPAVPGGCWAEPGGPVAPARKVLSMAFAALGEALPASTAVSSPLSLLRRISISSRTSCESKALRHHINAHGVK